MAKGMTDSIHYENAADKIRSLTGLEQTYRPGQLPEGIGQVYDAARQLCLQAHHISVHTGDGSGELKAQIPFVPDCVLLCGLDPLAEKQVGAVLLLSADLRAFSYFAAAAVASKGAGTAPYTAALRRSALLGSAGRMEYTDGTMRFYGLPSAAGGRTGVFAKGAAYLVAAFRYTEQSDQERITAFVRSLSDEGGSVLLCKSIVEAAFPDGSFDALIAERPNWEFTLGE